MKRAAGSPVRLLGYSAAVLSLSALASGEFACSTDSGHPSLVSVSGQPSSGGRAAGSAAEGGSAELAGASGEEAGASGAGGSESESGGAPPEFGGSGGKPPTTPAVCDPRASWSADESLSGVTTAAVESLLALTPDELDLAFLRDGNLYVAHRATSSAAFVSGAPLAIPPGWSAASGASLSADGKRLLLVSDPDRKRLGEWTRASREAAFSGPIDTRAFVAINQDSGFTGRVYAAPTVSAGDDQLFFNSSFVHAESTIVVSSRNGSGAWSAPRTLSAGVFDGGEGQRRLPTAVSADGRTLFYFNEESAEQEARWRATNSLGSPLYDMLSLGARRGAAPNFACNRLYSAANGDVVVEKD